MKGQNDKKSQWVLIKSRGLLQALSYHMVPNIGTVLVVAFMLFGYTAWAAPDRAPLSSPATPGDTASVISYQGKLTDSNGNPLNGNIDITFKLYTAPTGGTALWTEAHVGANAVPVDNGLFNVLLGSLTPIPSSVWSNYTLYLGVQVGSDAEMTPREVVGGVPYAGGAGTASLAQNGSPDFTVGSGDNYTKLAEGGIGLYRTPNQWNSSFINMYDTSNGYMWGIHNQSSSDNALFFKFHKPTSGYPTMMSLSYKGDLWVRGNVSYSVPAEEVTDPSPDGYSTSSTSFVNYGSTNISFNLSDPSLVYVYLRGALYNATEGGQLAFSIDGENRGHEHSQPIYIENQGNWRTFGASAIVELGTGDHTLRPVFRVIGGGTLVAGAVSYGYFVLGRQP